MLLDEARVILDGTAAAARRTRRAASATNRLALATKAGASHELLRRLLEAYTAESDAAEIDVLLCGMAVARLVRTATRLHHV